MTIAKGDEKYQILAVVLFDDFKYSQIDISNLLKESQEIVSSWIKIGRLKIKNKHLEKEVLTLRESIHKLGYTPIKNLSEDIIAIL